MVMQVVKCLTATPNGMWKFATQIGVTHAVDFGNLEGPLEMANTKGED